MMKNLKSIQEKYSAPVAEVVNYHSEGVICASSKDVTTEVWDVYDLSNSGN